MIVMIDKENVISEPTTSDRFSHILSAIDTVETTLRDCSLEDLAHDRTRRLALERLIEIIGVASDHITDSVKVAETQVDWRTLSDMSKRLECASERMEPDYLWRMASETVVPLKALAIGRATKLL